MRKIRQLPLSTRLPVIFGLAIPLAVACLPAAGEDDLFQHLDGGWITHSYWFQGEAEVNFYDASVVKYAHPRKTRDIVHILVSEKHDPDLLVKADDWRQPGLVDMLKFNYVVSVPTGIYSYQQMMSVFFQHRDSQVAKMTLASHEWCGNTFKELVHFGSESRFEFNTYWDGQGNGSYEVDFPRNMTLYDALPVQLRMLEWRPGLVVGFGLVGSQFSSKASRPEVAPARLRVLDGEKITVEAGEFEAHPVVVEHAAGVDRLWFEAAFPHRMLRWETHDGHRYALRKSEKLAYWKLNQPGDESYRN